MMNTERYFNMTKEELTIIKFDDWTKEDCLLADASYKTFWAETEDLAYETAAWQVICGYAEKTRVLKTVNGKYAILTW